MLRRFLEVFLSLCLSIFLAACGGGGGGGTQTNNAPVASLVVDGDVRTEGGQLRAVIAR